MRVVTYTAVTGNIDPIRTDIKCLTHYNRFSNPRLNARAMKILSHLFVDADISIWIDANLELRVDPMMLVDMLGVSDVALFAHSERKDILEEAEAVIRLKKDRPDVVREQIKFYHDEHAEIPKALGMTFLLVRRHNEMVRMLNEQWFAHVCRFSVRDQISFPVVFGDVARYWDAQPLRQCEYYVRRHHQKEVLPA